MSSKRKRVPLKEFKSFVEWWHFAKHLSESQKRIIYDSLSSECQRKLQRSCKTGGWEDLLNRDEINNIIDDLKLEMNLDLINIRSLILKGKSVYLPTSSWETAITCLYKFPMEEKYFAIGGIKSSVCKENDEVTLLVPLKAMEV